MPALNEFLAQLGLKQYIALFDANHIDWDMLSELSSDDLKEIGISSLGHRKKLLAAIAAIPSGPVEAGQAFASANVEEDLRPTPARGGTAEHASSAERREVTTVFADLTGYTKLSRELDTEDVHTLLSAFYDRFDAIVKRMGGTVDRHIGDCVMAVFGAPVSYGNDAERALRASLEMHRAMDEISLRFGRQLSVHIGVAAGNVLFSTQGQGALREHGFTLTGDSVNLASRLANHAQGRNTLITAPIHYALGDRIECDAPDAISVKGLEQPVQVYRVIGFRESTPERPLIGRTNELAVMSQALDSCRADRRGGAIAVVADAGLGKTRLIEELVHIAVAKDFETHKVLVFDFGLGDSQDPVRGLAGSFCGLGERAEPSAVRAAVEQLRTRGILNEQYAMFLTVFLGAPLDAESMRVHDAMSDEVRQEGLRTMLRLLLRGHAMERPLLLIVEDIHWANREMLNLLALIASVTAEAPILLVMSARPEGFPIDVNWLASTKAADLRRIDLAPLSRVDALRIARATFQPSEEVICACVERAEGNPLFLEQLLRHASEQGHDSVPGSIQSIIQARLDRLSPIDRRTLEAAAILGQRFSMVEVTAVAVIEVYDEKPLVEASLIRRHKGGYLFAHALIRDAVLRTILRDDLRTLHRRAAEWFRPRDAILHAEHLAAAKDGGAALAFLAAAREARAGHRKETCLELAERGLVLAEDHRVQGDLFCLQGEMLRDLGRSAEAIEAFNAALRIARRPSERCRAKVGIVAVMRIMDRIDEALELLDEAEAIGHEADLALELSEIHYLRGSLHFPRGQLDGCLREHSKSLEFAERVENPERRALALSGLGDAHYARGRMFTAHKAIEQCLALCEKHNLVAVEAANRFMLATVKIYMIDTERALSEALTSSHLANKVGHARAEIVSRLTASWILVSMGEVDAALKEVNLGLAKATQLGAKRFEPFLEETSARISLAAGHRAEASDIAEGALAKLRELGAMSFIGPWLLSTVARVSSESARRREVLAEGEALLAKGSVGHNYYRFYRYAMDACAAAGEWSEVRRYADLLAVYTAEEPAPWSDFFIARAHALADTAEGLDTRDRLRQLRTDAEAARLRTAIPAIDAALASVATASNCA
jgi:class 3 adenylate cyclase/tetratricopeptide (TPR) repeat protein